MPAWLKRKPFEFSASGAGASAFKERDDTNRPSFSQRLRSTLWANKIGFHLAYILVLVVCLVQTGNKVFQRHHESKKELLIDIFTHVAWPPLPWLICLNSFLIPLQYAFNPPTIPNHAQLLKRDPVRRASYPKEVQEPGQFPQLGTQEVNYTISVFYAAALFFFSRQIGA